MASIMRTFVLSLGLVLVASSADYDQTVSSAIDDWVSMLQLPSKAQDAPHKGALEKLEETMTKTKKLLDSREKDEEKGALDTLLQATASSKAKLQAVEESETRFNKSDQPGVYATNPNAQFTAYHNQPMVAKIQSLQAWCWQKNNSIGWSGKEWDTIVRQSMQLTTWCHNKVTALNAELIAAGGIDGLGNGAPTGAAAAQMMYQQNMGAWNWTAYWNYFNSPNPYNPYGINFASYNPNAQPGFPVGSGLYAPDSTNADGSPKSLPWWMPWWATMYGATDTTKGKGPWTLGPAARNGEVPPEWLPQAMAAGYRPWRDNRWKLMVYGNIAGPTAKWNDIYPALGAAGGAKVPIVNWASMPLGSLYWGNMMRFWRPLMLDATGNLKNKTMHLQRQLEGVEFTSMGSEKDEKVRGRKVALQKELDGVQAELAEINTRYAELEKNSKDAATGDLDAKKVEKPEWVTAAEGSKPEGGAKLEASPLGFSAPEGEAKVSAVPKPQAIPDVQPLEMVSETATETKTPIEMATGAPTNNGVSTQQGGQYLDSVPNPAAQQELRQEPSVLNNAVTMSQGQGGGLPEGSLESLASEKTETHVGTEISIATNAKLESEFESAQDQALKSGYDLSSGVALSTGLGNSVLTGKRPAVPDAYLSEAIKAGYDPARDQAWQHFLGLKLLQVHNGVMLLDMGKTHTAQADSENEGDPILIDINQL